MSDDALIEAMARAMCRAKWFGIFPVSILDERVDGFWKMEVVNATAALAAIRKTHAVVRREALQGIDAIARTSVGPGYSAILSHTQAMLSAGENHDER